MTSGPSHRTPKIDGFVLLPLEESDYPAIARWLSDPDDMRKVCANAFRHPLEREAYLDYFVRSPYVQSTGSRNDRRCYKFVDKTAGRTAGMASFTRIDRRNDHGHIGLVTVDPRQRRRGIGAAMLGALLDLGFGGLRLHRIDLVVVEGNTDAHRFYVRRLGFTDEGLVREIARTDAGYLSWHSLSMLAREWRRAGPHDRT